MLAIILVAIVATNCKKDQKEQPNNLAETYDVSFNVNSIAQDGTLKSSLTDTIICDTLKADYVVIRLNGVWDTIPVFYVGNYLWTNTIKLAPGSYNLSEFLVYSNNHTPLNKLDDILLMATPHSGSLWSGYVTTALNQSFTVVADNKNSVKMDVVCFKPSVFAKFGFTYFYLNQLVIRQQWFFGDFCIKDASQYNNSDYHLQPNWVTTGYRDAPAIFKIEVWRGGTLQNTFTNDDAAHHYGDKVSVTYGDYINQVDQFTFKLYILVKQGTMYNFVLFNTWSFNDISNIPIGIDNVSDFILGSCYDPANPPQLVLAPWLNLPVTASYTINGAYAPGSLGGYVDATLGSIGSGYDIQNGNYASWCSDHQTVIYVGSLYNMDVYSSLYPSLLPAFAQVQSGKWAKINWLFNHQDWYPNLKWYEVQQFIWLYDNVAWNGVADGGVPALSDPLYPTRAQLMKTNADAYGVNYVPSPGGWSAIIFVPTGTPPNATVAAVQTMMVKIDP